MFGVFVGLVGPQRHLWNFFQLFHFVNFEPYWSNILRFRIVLDQTLAPVPIMSLDGAPHLSGNSPTGVGWRNFYGY